MLVTMNPPQTYLLSCIALISGLLIVYAIRTYLKYLHKKTSEMDGRGEGPSRRRLFEGLESQIVLTVFLIASILIFTGWYFYHSNHIEGLSDTPGATAQTEAINEWLKQLLCCLVGCATFFISLAFVVVRLSTSAFSIRVFKSALNPLDEDKGLIWGGVFIYCFAALMCLALVATLSFQVLGLPDLKTFWGFWAIPLLLVLCVIAFEILGLFFVRAFRITQSDYIIGKELNRISSMCNNRKGNPGNPNSWDDNEVEKSLQLISNVINLSIQQYDSRSSEYGIRHLSEKMKGWIGRQDITESYIEKMTNSTKVALLQGDEITAIDIIKAVEKSVLGGCAGIAELSGTKAVGMCNIKFAGAGGLRNLFRRAFLWNGEAASLCCMNVIDAADLQKIVNQADSHNNKDTVTLTIEPLISVDDIEERFRSHMELLIESYSDLGHFSVERNYIRSAGECVRVLKVCNEELFNFYNTKDLKSKEPPQDTTDRSLTKTCDARGVAGIPNEKNGERFHMKEDLKAEKCNLYDLSAECVRSASLVSQIADKRNYETLVVRGAGKTSQMHGRLYTFLAKGHPGLSLSTEPPKLPKKLLSHYIWSIEDAGVSAANSNLEWGAIKYIECLENFGKNIFDLAGVYNDDENIKIIAILMTHTSTAIRNIGQQLAKRKFQEGSIRAMSAIRELASKMLTRGDMMWVWEDRNEGNSEKLGEDTTEKLAFVRATWNIKDIGRSAAESGIEKAVVLAADKLFTLLKEALDPAKSVWKDDSKKTEGLLSIGEGFYEISMITKEKRLQDALTRIIYYNVISVRCLAEDGKKILNEESSGEPGEIPKDNGEAPVRNIFLKTFVHLQPVDEFTVENVREYLKALTLNQNLRSYDEYKGSIDDFSASVYSYWSLRSLKQPRAPETQEEKAEPMQEPSPHEEPVLGNTSHEGKP